MITVHDPDNGPPAASLLKRKERPDTADPAVDALEEIEAATGIPVNLLCAVCSRAITTRAALIEIQGGSEHDCTNPHGFRFVINCYREAPGCAGTGEWTAEHSWFHDCRWRYALCTGCHAHLGWEFRGAANFFGLIRNRLVQSDSQRH